ncbi:polyprenyl synthetase family protein, partial [Undibacterium sp.]|uniref:polyprenyl synthetase family protein n=1 Tax=Undibacterium sp. TaxID=1914977 RepID=UPI00374DB62F
MSDSFRDWIKATQTDFELTLQDYLPSPAEVPARLHEAMRYAALDGGKRVRPLLVYAAGRLFDAPVELLNRAAAALEMIHAYSLVHDDMPCMDDDALRRGKPTVHVQYDEATALLVGDALQAQAFLVLADADDAGTDNAVRKLAMVRLLAQAAGSVGMCGGQAIDLASVGLALTQEQLEHMHRLKTGALLRASVLMGAMAGKTLAAAEVAALDTYAGAIGLAFQVVDDVLDATADSATLGKTAGK